MTELQQIMNFTINFCIVTVHSKCTKLLSFPMEGGSNIPTVSWSIRDNTKYYTRSSLFAALQFIQYGNQLLFFTQKTVQHKGKKSDYPVMKPTVHKVVS